MNNDLTNLMCYVTLIYNNYTVSMNATTTAYPTSDLKTRIVVSGFTDALDTGVRNNTLNFTLTSARFT
jgi:hypothetical protein